MIKLEFHRYKLIQQSELSINHPQLTFCCHPPSALNDCRNLHRCRSSPCQPNAEQKNRFLLAPSGTHSEGNSLRKVETKAHDSTSF